MTAVGGWKLLAILALAGFVTSFGAGVLIAVYDADEVIAKPARKVAI